MRLIGNVEIWDGWLQSIEVNGDQQRKGIGSKLVE
jgi:hypothetical protein